MFLKVIKFHLTFNLADVLVVLVIHEPKNNNYVYANTCINKHVRDTVLVPRGRSCWSHSSKVKLEYRANMQNKKKRS